MTTMLTRRGLDPFRSMRGLDQVLTEVLTEWPFARGTAPLAGAWLPPVDITENAEGVTLVAELPGVQPDDVKVTYENGVLTLRGEKKQAAESTTATAHRYERVFGTFERSFRLGTPVDPSRIDARFAHGVLTVVVPKAEEARPREIVVKVS